MTHQNLLLNFSHMPIIWDSVPGVDMVSVTETGVSISPIDHFQVTITTGEHPPCFTPIDPQNPPKTLKFRSKFKVCVCLTVCNHACTTLPRAGRPSLYIPRIPSRPPGALEGIETPRMRLKNTCGVHKYSFMVLSSAPNTRCCRRLRGFRWVQ